MPNLWPDIPQHVDVVYGVVELSIYQSEVGKPVLLLKVGDTEVCITANIAEMIGGAAIGARKRWEDHHTS